MSTILELLQSLDRDLETAFREAKEGNLQPARAIYDELHAKKTDRSIIFPTNMDNENLEILRTRLVMDYVEIVILFEGTKKKGILGERKTPGQIERSEQFAKSIEALGVPIHFKPKPKKGII